MTYEITWTMNGQINITGKKNNIFFTAQMIDLSDCGHGFTPHSLHNISELEAVSIINNSQYICVSERMMKEIASDLEYQAQEEEKRQSEIENREEESCPLCDTYHDDWNSCFSIREQY